MSEIETLLEAVTALASLVSPEKARVLADTIQKSDGSKVSTMLSSVASTAAGKSAVERLVEVWQKTSTDSAELARMLLAATHAVEHVSKHQSIELVWTGPTTPYVSARRTEQALLQVIDSAKRLLFLTSFVAYDVSSVVKALNGVIDRGVSVSMLLESSENHGGSVSFDVIGQMKKLVPSVRLYAWCEREAPFAGGRVHAKVAVADGETCFITSANLTDYAMQRNMEVGVLLKGGDIPRSLHDHLQGLIDIGVITTV